MSEPAEDKKQRGSRPPASLRIANEDPPGSQSAHATEVEAKAAPAGAPAPSTEQRGPQRTAEEKNLLQQKKLARQKKLAEQGKLARQKKLAEQEKLAQAKGEASPQVRGADGPAGEVTRREPKGPKNKPGQRQAPSVAEETLASLEQRKKTQESVAQLRRQRSRSLFLRLALFVLLPTLLMTGYAGFIASDSYESVAMFSIQSADNSPSLAMEGLIGLAGANPSSRDTLAAREYVLSREMLAVLDEKLHLLDKYRSRKVDFFSRLPAEDSIEEAYDYYLDKVRLGYDSNSGVLTLRVQAFTANDAHTAAETILQASEDKVNLLAERAQQDGIVFAEKQLEKAEARLAKSRTELVALQQERGEFSPQQTAEAALSIRTQLEGALANARAEYATLSSYMAKDSPQVIAARQKVVSLAGQAQSENKRLVAPDSDGLNSSLVDFERVLVEKEFATHAYQSTLTSLELARSDAARQHRYLAVIAQPSLPDEAQYPRRALLVLTTFLLCLVLFGIGSLGWAAIKEHARLS